MKKILGILLALIILLSMGAAFAEGEITTFEGLKTAVATNGIYVLGADIEVSEKITIGTDVTIKGNGYKLTHANSYTGTLFKVASTGKLTLENIVIDGGDNWKLADGVEEKWEATSKNNERCTVNFPSDFSSSVTLKKTAIVNEGGTLTLGQGTKITNFVCESAPAILKQNGGETLLDGCELSHNFIGKGNGGVIRADNNAEITMKEGTIVTDNVGVDCNGTFIMVYNQSLFTMNGGTISNNRGYRGNSNGFNMAVYVHKESTFEMYGGTITNNKGTTAGGVGTNYSLNTTIKINEGSIVAGNKGRITGDDVDIQMGGTVELDPSAGSKTYVRIKVENGKYYYDLKQAINDTTGDITVVLADVDIVISQYDDSNSDKRINIGNRNITILRQGRKVGMRDLEGTITRGADGIYKAGDEEFKKAFNIGDGSVTIGNYEITLEPNGGSVTPSVVLTGVVNELPIPTRDNYIFLGWFTATGRLVTNKDLAEISENITLTAMWIPNNTDSSSGGGCYYPTPTPTPVPPIVIMPKTGDMPLWYSIAQFLGLVK